MMLLVQAAIDDVKAAVVAIATMFALRDHR